MNLCVPCVQKVAEMGQHVGLYRKVGVVDTAMKHLFSACSGSAAVRRSLCGSASLVL